MIWLVKWGQSSFKPELLMRSVPGEVSPGFWMAWATSPRLRRGQRMLLARGLSVRLGGARSPSLSDGM